MKSRFCFLAPVLLSASVLFPLVVACTAPEPVQVAEEMPTEEADRREILDIIGKRMEAYTNADTDLMASLYADDAVRMPPDRQIIVGVDDIHDNIVTTFATYDREVTLHADEIIISGDLAFSRGSWVTRQTPKVGGDTTEQYGTWVYMLRRQPDEGWKIQTSIWNRDHPPAT